MLNPRLAGRYAKSLIDLAQERGQLEEVYKDMQYLQAVCKASKPFVNLLKSPVIPGQTKQKALGAVMGSNVGMLTTAFINLLISKGRETFVPEIVYAFIEHYNRIKGIHKVKLTVASEVSEDVKSNILGKIRRDTNMQNIELETVVDEDIIGGFVLEYNNNLVDASVLRDLKDIKKQFDQNTFVQQIR